MVMKAEPWKRVASWSPLCNLVWAVASMRIEFVDKRMIPPGYVWTLLGIHSPRDLLWAPFPEQPMRLMQISLVLPQITWPNPWIGVWSKAMWISPGAVKSSGLLSLASRGMPLSCQKLVIFIDLTTQLPSEENREERRKVCAHTAWQEQTIFQQKRLRPAHPSGEQRLEWNHLGLVFQHLSADSLTTHQTRHHFSRVIFGMWCTWVLGEVGLPVSSSLSFKFCHNGTLMKNGPI